MANAVEINGKLVGHNHPAYLVGEVGINHNGDMDIAKQLIKAAKEAGLDAVKFQKRNPDVCVPEEQKTQMRDTPWGYISYLDYRFKVEFDKKQYQEIDDYCKEIDMTWFASAWDESSVDFMEELDTCAYKVASASLTDHSLLKKMRDTGKPVILSTGMSTMEEIREAVAVLDKDKLIITHSTSAYPCPPDELNLRMIPTLMNEFDCPIGYSGHEVGLVPSAIAIAMGACMIERHITLDRAMWGSDQAASVEPKGVSQLVNYIRVTERALGDGVKRVYESEMSSRLKLRRI